MRVRGPAAAAAAALVVILSPGGAGAGSSGWTLPNLVPNPPAEIRIGPSDIHWPTFVEQVLDLIDGEPTPVPTPEPALRFTTQIGNRGQHSLEILGVPADAVAETADAHQCVVWLVRHGCGERVRIDGSLVWHPQHGHFHFEDFALYELRRVQPDGRPDMSPGGLVAGSEKVSFCLESTRRVDDEPFDLVEEGRNHLYGTCNGFVQGIDSGWMDEYYYELPGQQILLRDVPDGDYALVLTVDPDGVLHETTTVDNRAHALIRIFNGGREVGVL